MEVRVVVNSWLTMPELGPQPLLLLDIGHVLQGNTHRFDRAFLGEDGVEFIKVVTLRPSGTYR